VHRKTFLLTTILSTSTIPSKKEPPVAAIKPLDAISSKWSRVAGQSGQSYLEGVNNPRADWATQTVGAEANYNAGVQSAITRKAFAGGVKAAGTQKWQTNAAEKGPGRYQQGVQLAQNNYAVGFEPYRTVISNLVLPKRGPKGDPGNINRVSAVSNALFKKKLELQARG